MIGGLDEIKAQHQWNHIHTRTHKCCIEGAKSRHLSIAEGPLSAFHTGGVICT